MDESDESAGRGRRRETLEIRNGREGIMNEDEKWKQAIDLLKMELMRCFGHPETTPAESIALRTPDRLRFGYSDVMKCPLSFRSAENAYEWRWWLASRSVSRRALAKWISRQEFETPEQVLVLVSAIEYLKQIITQVEKLVGIFDLLGVDEAYAGDNTGSNLGWFIYGLPPIAAFTLSPKFQMIANRWENES